MSQKSTARTGSEGDAEFRDIGDTNVRTGTSSCRSKRDIFGGPFGDSPFDPAKDAYQDYLIFMFPNNDDSTDTSESSQNDLDLYNLRHNYTHQLNLVRKKLNLMELCDDEPHGCIITEIAEDEPSSSKQNDKNQIENSAQFQKHTSIDTTVNEANTPKGYEFNIIHPFSLNFKTKSEPFANTSDRDYSPPNKKVCQRLKTPRFASLSEGNVPYHTKVGIHESIFTIDSKPEENLNSKFNNFTETRQTQCNEEEFTTFCKTSYCIGDKVTKLSTARSAGTVCDERDLNVGVHFPNVIIKENRNIEDEESSLSTKSSKIFYTSSSNRKLNLNSVSSDDEIYTVTKLSTIIDTSEQKKKYKSKKLRNKSRVTTFDEVTMWDEISKIQSDSNNKQYFGDDLKEDVSSYDFEKLNSYVEGLSRNLGIGDIVRTESDKSVKSKKKYGLNQYIKQYVNYKHDIERAKSEVQVNRMTNATFVGEKISNIHDELLDPSEKVCQSESSVLSDEDRCGRLTSEDMSESNDSKKFWQRLCVCLCPNRATDDD